MNGPRTSHMAGRRRIAAGLAFSSVALFAGGRAMDAAAELNDRPHPIPAVAVCQEDDPCWNQATMGNRCWGEPNDSQPGGIEVICTGEASEVYASPRFTG